MAQSDSDSPVLRLRDISFAYPASNGGVAPKTIEGLSIEFFAGELVAILGASGCGKTTLLNIIAGILEPHSGGIEYGGTASRKGIGYIFQQDPLLPWRNVESNIMLARDMRRISGDDSRSRIMNHLHRFHLDDTILTKYPAQLSGGMRQRVSIIQQLMFDPQLLLLDEPFAALDFYTKLKLEDEFRDLIKSENKAAILVTHDIEEAIAMADKVYVMTTGGVLSNEFDLRALKHSESPELTRGSTEFAEQFRIIWQQLRLLAAI